MTVRLLFFFYFITALTAHAQFEVSAGTGYGWFSMESLHKFQSDVKSLMPVDARITDAFPQYLFYEASASYTFFKQQFVGISLQFGSTGGRVYYADYSGSVYSDQRVRYHSLAINIGEVVILPNHYSLRMDLHPALTESTLKLTGSTTVGDSRYEESNKVKSLNVTVQPTIELRKKWDKFGVKTMLGYSIDLVRGKMKVPGSDAYLIGIDNRPIVANWRGLRAGIGVFYSFGKTEIDE